MAFSLSEIKGFHGTSYDFERFNHKKYLDMGDGSQEFGWGTYVTDNPDIAEEYGGRSMDANTGMYDKGEQRLTAQTLYEIAGSTISDERVSREIVEEIRMYIYVNKRLDNSFLNSLQSKYIGEYGELSCEIGDFFGKLQDYGLHFVKANNYVYEVEIPDNNGYNYLYWFEVASEQISRNISDGLKRLSSRFGNIGSCDGIVSENDTGKDIYEKLVSLLGSPKAASLFLMNMCGIDGIVYPIGTVFDFNGEEGNNYVIFDANKVRIVKKQIIEGRKMGINEYTSRYYRENYNFSIKAYHTTREYDMYDIFSCGYIDPKAEHKGECPYDIIWFSIKEDDYAGPYRFSYKIDSRTFEEKHFQWMNDIHLATPDTIDVMDERLRVEKINGVSLDRVYERFYDGTKEGFDEFIDHVFQLTDYQLSNELFVMKILQQYGFKRSDFFAYEDDEDTNESVGTVEEERLDEVESSDISLKSFEVQDELNPKFWVNNKINSRVRLRLMDIADEFIDTLAVDWVKPEDIVLTGSIANYNWSKYSDVDVHILIDFKKVWNKKEFVQDYFDSKKALWSQEHGDLKIYGFPVEMYVEDSNEKNSSSGVYSLNKNKWIKEPDDFQNAELNESYIKKQSAKIMTQIDDIIEKVKKEKDNHRLEVSSEKMKKLFDKLHKQRQESIKKHGEMGTYNIIWKVLRRTGYLDKIWDNINMIYNKVNSLK